MSPMNSIFRMPLTISNEFNRQFKNQSKHDNSYRRSNQIGSEINSFLRSEAKKVITLLGGKSKEIIIISVILLTINLLKILTN